MTREVSTKAPVAPAGSGEIVAVAVLLFAAITAWRFSDSDPTSAIGVLYVLPIAVLAAGRGAVAGLMGAAVALALTFAWSRTAGDLSLEGHVTRAIAFLTMAVVIGWQVQRQGRAQREADRWFSISNDMCCVATLDGYLTRVNAAWTRQLGWTEEQLLSRPFAELVHPDDREGTIARAAAMAAGAPIVAEFENRYRAADGTWHWLLWSTRSDGGWIYAAARDITERKQLEERLRELAVKDALTGIPNRHAWDERLDASLKHAARSGEPICVVLVDFDNLKQVNDSLGHDAGDRALEECAAAWESALRDTDLLARLGGDEFAALLPICDAEQALDVVQRLRDATPPGCSFSAGVARWDGAESSGSLLKRADDALYAAKDAGRATARAAAPAP